ncbi:hypothetical protein PC116_g9186 [Phytophthora cactorum]|uniref:Uncharacterized protein n=1 Tax=Phytophthora cactorum TaxID=29920 RepID=A0A8T1L1F6_9STRA|nr:hypothetical protein PC113_g8315 [Phytophthora cactorum]KAG4242943.1 hypothetical protein PC116_g9186 [Phytophthora cactorum]
MEFYIRLIWEFQSVVEDRMEVVPNEKGVRAFSLFPVSTSFTKLHIVINGTTLAGFVSRIRDRGQGNLMEDWDMPQVKISTASFKVMRWTVMRRAFGIDRFETRKEECPLSKTEFLQLPVEEKYEHASHLFANEIKSDGHLAGFNRFRAWNESQKRKFPDYKSVIEGMPSFKTSSYEKYLKRLDHFWQHAAFLLRFCLERPYLKWRFFRKRMARVAVDEIARRIVPTVSRLTCVAYGDWSRRDCIKDHAPSPVKGLKEALRKRATVVSMDEFRTSKLCSQCHQSLSSVQYPTPVFSKGSRNPRGGGGRERPPSRLVAG